MNLSEIFSLKGKNILITGGTGYLGTPMTQLLLNEGANVIALSRSRPEVTNDENFTHFSLDLTNMEELKGVVEKIKTQFPKIHGLVNGAYAGIVGSTEQIQPKDFQLANYFCLELPYFLATTLKENLSPNGGESSSIVNIASMYGIVSPDPKAYDTKANQNPPHYGASKAGMIQLTKYLAVEWGREGIRVNAISPGPFPNPEKNDQAFMDRLSEKVPMGRIGDAKELAPSLIFLLSNASSYINGENLRVDGGWTVW